MLLVTYIGYTIKKIKVEAVLGFPLRNLIALRSVEM